MTGHDLLPFDELRVGDRHTSRGRTVTEADVVNFAGISGDFDPLHVDHEHAAQTPFGKPIAHGLLGLAWVTGMASYCPPVQTEIFLTVREWKFLKPMYVGDTLRLVNEVVELEPKGRRRGRVVWLRKLVNQRGETVQEGIFETLVTRARPASKGPHFDKSKQGPARQSDATPTDESTASPGS
jgi:acyl dehydratase